MIPYVECGSSTQIARIVVRFAYLFKIKSTPPVLSRASGACKGGIAFFVGRPEVGRAAGSGYRGGAAYLQGDADGDAEHRRTSGAGGAGHLGIGIGDCGLRIADWAMIALVSARRYRSRF